MTVLTFTIARGNDLGSTLNDISFALMHSQVSTLLQAALVAPARAGHGTWRGTSNFQGFGHGQPS